VSAAIFAPLNDASLFVLGDAGMGKISLLHSVFAVNNLTS
jgi:hypothetical protein